MTVTTGSSGNIALIFYADACIVLKELILLAFIFGKVFTMKFLYSLPIAVLNTSFFKSYSSKSNDLVMIYCSSSFLFPNQPLEMLLLYVMQG